MEALELKADVREATRRHVKQLRQEGLVPAVLYGKDLEPALLQIEEKALTKVLRQAGTHQLISLKIDQKKPQMTLARDIQRDVLKYNYLHVDFYAVRMTDKVTAQVPLVFVGEAPAVPELGGILTQGLDQLDIECLPGDLIASIEVNVEGLTQFNDSISVADLTVPDTITVLSDSESLVAKIEPPRLEEEAVEEEEEEMAEVSVEPEVLTEAKDRSEEEE